MTRLQQTERMETLGRMVSGITHDFKNIFQVLQGNLELIERTKSLPPTSDMMLRDMHQVLQDGDEMLQNLLRFAQGELDLSLEPLDTAETLTSIAAMLRHSLRPGFTLNLSLAPTLPTLLADRMLLERILLNLVLNAQQAMPEPGIIHLRALVLNNQTQDTRHDLPLIWQRGDHEGPVLALEVQDQGTGISDKQAPRLFEPFFTTRRDQGGTGLGLSVVYQASKQLGAQINIFSKPGRGTLFQLCWKTSP